MRLRGRSGSRPHCAWLAIAVVLLATACGRDETPTSAVLVTIDTLRADHVSAWGYPRPTSPQLDRFMARGTRFHWAFSTSSRTAPSHTSLMTGRYPSFTTVSIENGRYPLDPSTPTLAQLAREQGLRTAAIVSNPVLQRPLGLARGFELYDDRLRKVERNRTHPERPAGEAVDHALRFLKEVGDAPFFLWLHVQEPHGPYTPPASAQRALEAAPPPPVAARALDRGADHSGRGAIPAYQFLEGRDTLAEYVALYDAEIRHVDGQLGRFFAALEQAGRMDDTLVVVTADHGEAFGEDGYFLAHGHGIGTDQTHVPLAFVGPGVVTSVRDEPVSGVDVFSTIVDALGLARPGDVAGRSLLDALRGGALHPAQGFAESVTQRAAFGRGGYLRKDRRAATDGAFWDARNPYTGAPRIALGEARFERLEADAASTRRSVPLGRASSDDERIERAVLSEALRAFSGAADAAERSLEPQRRPRKLEADERSQLRALGYVE